MSRGSAEPAIDAALAQAADWFALLRSGDADERQRRRWQAWLDQHPAHREAWARIESVGRQFRPLQADDGALGSAALRELRRQRGTRRRVLGTLGVLAGGGLLALGAWRHESLSQAGGAWLADFGTGVGEVREVVLADGSRVWLNTDTAFDADFSATERRLHLWRGEILLQTAPASAGTPPDARPLRVQTAQGLLRPMGTRFSVRQDARTSALSVFEGRVEIAPKHAALRAVLAPGEAAVFDSRSIEATGPASRAREAWSRGLLLAENITLGELVRELGRYRRAPLHVTPEAARLRVLGSYPLRDPERVLDMLEGALPIRLQRRLGWWTTIDLKTPFS